MQAISKPGEPTQLRFAPSLLAIVFVAFVLVTSFAPPLHLASAFHAPTPPAPPNGIQFPSTDVGRAPSSFPAVQAAGPSALYVVAFSFNNTSNFAGSIAVQVGSQHGSSNGANLSFSLPNGSYDYSVGMPVQWAAGPNHGVVLVHGAAQIVVIDLTRLFSAVFHETGLALGTNWSVSASAVPNPGSAFAFSTSANDTLWLSTGKWEFYVASVAGYSVSPAAGDLLLNGTGTQVNVTFVGPTIFGPIPLPSIVAFHETGLPLGWPWSVNFDGAYWATTAPLLPISVYGGAYNYTANPTPGYSVAPPTGAVSVPPATSFLRINLTYTALTPGSYTVAVFEFGLPSGLAWNVTVGGATHTAIAKPTWFPGVTLFPEPNGTYNFSTTAHPTSTMYGSPSHGVVVVKGSSVAVVVGYSGAGPCPTVDPATFNETGLPSGTNWSVTVDGLTVFSTSNALSDPLGGPFSVGSVPGFVSVPTTGLSTGDVCYFPHSTHFASHLLITFYPARGTLLSVVSIRELGLPSGANWSISVAGFTESSSGSAMNFSEPNGSFDFAVGPTPGWLPNVTGGTIQVQGQNISLTVHFALGPSVPVTVREVGLPAGLVWSFSVSSGESPALTYVNATLPRGGGRIALVEPTVPLAFSVVAPRGYGAFLVTGGNATTFNGSNISAVRSNALIVHFGVLRTAGFLVVNTTRFPGLAPGLSWSVNLSAVGPGSMPAPANNSTTGAEITFILPQGAHFRYTIHKPADYRLSVRAQGILVQSRVGTTKIIRFAPLTGKVRFLEQGLPRATRWTVLLTSPFAATLSGVSGGSQLLQEALVNGTYNYSVASVGALSPTVPTGSFIIVAPDLVIVVVIFH